MVKGLLNRINMTAINTTTVTFSPIYFQGSSWAMDNIVEVPIGEVADDPSLFHLSVFALIFRIVINLEKLFIVKKLPKARMGEDQLSIFESLETSLRNAGLDGKACLLRTICEIQNQPINRYSLIGGILTALLTPKRGAGSFMNDYVEAERLGQADSNLCSSVFASCRLSILNMFRTYSTTADKPTSDYKAGQDIDPGAFYTDHDQLASNSIDPAKSRSYNYIDDVVRIDMG